MSLAKIIFILAVYLPFLSFGQNTEDAENYYNFLEQQYFENDKGQYNDFLAKELRRHLQMYPQSEKEAQVLAMLANIEMQQGQNYKAFLDHLRLLYVFPKSTSALEAAKKLPKLFQSCNNINLKMMQDSIMAEVSQLPSLNAEESWFEMLSFVFGLQLSPLYPPLLQQIDDFRIRYGLHSKYDPVLIFWTAQIYDSQKKFYRALALCRQLLALHPTTNIRKNVLLAMGRISHHCPGCAKKAEKYYLETINTYSDSKEAALAQYYLSCLYEDSLAQPQIALNQLQLYVENYPQHSSYKEALQRMAHLAYRLKKWNIAASAWQMCFEKSTPPDSLSKEALTRLIEIQLERQKNYEQGAKSLVLYAIHFEDERKMFRAIQIYALKLHDKKKALKTLQKMKVIFPNSELIHKSRSIVEEIP